MITKITIKAEFDSKEAASAVKIEGGEVLSAIAFIAASLTAAGAFPPDPDPQRVIGAAVSTAITQYAKHALGWSYDAPAPKITPKSRLILP